MGKVIKLMFRIMSKLRIIIKREIYSAIIVKIPYNTAKNTSLKI